MSQTVTLELPEEMLLRYQQGAAAARKSLERFIVDRLGEAIPPLVNEEYTSIDDELATLEKLDDQALWAMVQSHISSNKQEQYDALLEQNSQGVLTESETVTLHALGEEARRLTLKKAHAYMLLKWRGHAIPALDTITKLA